MSNTIRTPDVNDAIQSVRAAEIEALKAGEIISNKNIHNEDTARVVGPLAVGQTTGDIVERSDSIWRNWKDL